MFELRQVIQRLRMGESARQIARSQHLGRATVESIHCIALMQDWLNPLGQIPDDVTLATFFKTPRKAPQNVSSVEPFREEILKWHAQGINATTMRRALHQKQSKRLKTSAIASCTRRLGSLTRRCVVSSMT